MPHTMPETMEVAFRFAPYNKRDRLIPAQLNPHGIATAEALLPMASIKSIGSTDKGYLALELDRTLAPPLFADRCDKGWVILIFGKGALKDILPHLSWWYSLSQLAHRRSELGPDAPTHTCPVCANTIPLAAHELGPWIACPVCDTLTRRDEPATALDGNVWHPCGECGMYHRNIKFSDVYFIFLVLAFWFRREKRYVCEACAWQAFRYMLLVNAVFLLGLIPTFMLLYKLKDGRDPRMEGLTEANKQATAGEMPEDAPLYARIQRVWPDHPALDYNAALGHLKAKRPEGARACLERSLKLCPSWEPARDLYAQLPPA